MPPPPKRIITLLEAHPSSSPFLDTDANTISDDGITGPSPAPHTPTTYVDSSSITNSRFPSRPRKHWPSFRRPHERWAIPPDTTTIPTSYSTSTEFSSTTSLYTSNSGFTTSTTSNPSPSMTISGPPVRRAHAVDFDIPDPPAWFPFLIATLLIFMLCLAVLFYCVNFPTTGRTIGRWREWIALRWPRRYGYKEITDADAREIELGSNFSGSSASPPSFSARGDVTTGGRGESGEAAPAGFTTSARTPALHNTPTLYSRRRKRENISLDTGSVAGLGIDLSGEPAGHLRGQKSFDDTLLRPDLDKPLPKPPLSPSSRAIQSAKAFLSTSNNNHQPNAPRSRKGSTDLEAGLLKPPPTQRQCPQRTTSHRSSSPPPSPGMRVLEMVGGSVEYAADKMSKFLYDQVKGDPEEGLLLPVRDRERERFAELEKVC